MNLSEFNAYFQVVDELLLYGADPSLYLTHGIGSVLCVAMSTQYEHRRSIGVRLHLVRYKKYKKCSPQNKSAELFRSQK